MSFSISASGTKDEALKQLESASGAGDPQHFTVCRDALKAAIQTIPDGCTVQCSANGHHDYNPINPSGDFQMSFSVRKNKPG